MRMVRMMSFSVFSVFLSYYNLSLVMITNLTTDLVTTCATARACARVLIPTAVPTASPTVGPTYSFRPTPGPTATPVPTANPTFAPTSTFAPSNTKGSISSVSPSHVVGASCFEVTIRGTGLSLSGKDVTSVTLAGVATTIKNQTANSVTVLTPKVANPLSIAGDIQVFAVNKRVTTLVKAFTFRTLNWNDFQDFTSQKLPAGIWTDAGTIPWAFSNDGGNIRLWKNGALGSSESFYVNLLWTSGRGNLPSEGGCVNVPSAVSFIYWAYSSYSFCYKTFSFSVQTNYSSNWQAIWSGTTGSNSGATPWLNASITLPNATTAMRIYVDTAIINACKSFAPVKIDNLKTSFQTQCTNTNSFCGIMDSPTLTPTVSPTVSPSRVPTPVPTPGPTEAPTYPPGTPSATPTRLPSESPSCTPTESPTVVPSDIPTHAPSVARTQFPTCSPTSQTKSPSRAPTGSWNPSLKPTIRSTTRRPSVTPTIAPSDAPVPTPVLFTLHQV